MTEHNKKPIEDIKVEGTAADQTSATETKTDYVGQIVNVVKKKGPPLLKKTLSVLACAANSTAKTLSQWAEKIQVDESNKADSQDSKAPKA